MATAYSGNKQTSSKDIKDVDAASKALPRQAIVAFIRHYAIEFCGQQETKIHVVKEYKLTDTSPLINLPPEVGSACISPDPNKHRKISYIPVTPGKRQLQPPTMATMEKGVTIQTSAQAPGKKTKDSGT
ncbi:hypothetical protein Tco_0749555 [Tanacetum coccineum]|uniref:Uncharacterized protein n=1 Tax=Tanacetum coccineum TaxID=301880 RepID=A0ABQ4YYR2_9ASTR